MFGDPFAIHFKLGSKLGNLQFFISHPSLFNWLVKEARYTGATATPKHGEERQGEAVEGSARGSRLGNSKVQ